MADKLCSNCVSINPVSSKVGRCGIDGGKLVEQPVKYLTDTCESHELGANHHIQAPQGEG